MTKSIEEDYPNLVALSKGAISGASVDWIKIKLEVRKVLEELDYLRTLIRFNKS